ncbi:unnamed protein product [Ectocarpus fasciculatus]
MDGAIPVERTQLATLLLVMFAAAAVPAVLAAILKMFFSVRLRSRLVRDDRRRFAGVFFFLATKAISVPAFCGGGRLCERRVHALKDDDDDSYDGGLHDEDVGGVGKSTMGDAKVQEEGDAQRAPVGGTSSRRGRPTTPSGRHGEDGGHGDRGGRSANRLEDGGTRKRAELDLPPRHWMCTVCKKVNMLPDEWAGRAGKDVHVVIKRKAVDTRAMYGVFKTKPAVPLCSKCQTPFNYSWRNGGGSDKLLQQRQQRLLDAALSRPTTAASTTAAAAVGSATDPALSAGADGPMDGESRGVAADAHRRVLAKAARFIRGLCSPCRRRRSASSKPFDGGGVAGAEEEPELWYGREFRRQLMTYFKPELSRPAGGGRYPVGARVACFAGKDAWYPGAVAASRENDTYDVRYDNGDIAQHVFSHMIRFEPVHADSRLTCCYYGLALAAAAAWPLAGSWYFSSTSSAAAASATTAAAFVALPALVVGAAGTLAVAFQFWEIYADNRSTGLCVATKFAVIFALPSMSLALVGGLMVVKSLKPASAGSWVEMLLLPSMLFSLTGGGYAHAVSPAYGKAWAVASSLWLLFLLLVALRLDGERGDARPAFGQMRWLGVYFPLWVFLLMLVAAHEALPYVWDVDVFRVPAPPPPPPSPLEGEGGGSAGGRVREVLSRLAGRLAASIAARRERARERAAAAAAAGAAAVAADAAAAGGTDAGDRAVGDETVPAAL